MGFLDNTPHDIFVSYAHVDNENAKGDTGWVDQFHTQLSILLSQKCNDAVNVWRDPELDRAEVFDKVIENAVLGSGLMIALITPKYLASDYCKQEIKWFREKAEKESMGFEVENRRRILPVLLYDKPPAEWPEAVQGTSGFEFHDGGWPLDPGSDAFEKKLRGLVESIETFLNILKSHSGGGGGSPHEPDAGATSFKVFLAGAADDMGSKCRQLAKQLNAEDGIEVISDVPPPFEEKEHAARVEEVVKGVDLSVHLLGNLPGEAVDEGQPEKTYPTEQVRIGKSARSQLILMPQDVEIDLVEDPAYRRFLEELREEDRDRGRRELVHAQKPRMLDAILAKKAAIEEAKRQQEKRQEAVLADLSAFLTLHPSDMGKASKLVDYFESRHIDWMSGSPADDAKFVNLLRERQLLLVFWGEVTREWVVKRLRSAVNIIWEENLDTELGVYVAPPAKTKEELRLKNCKVANNIDGFDPKTLEPMFA